MMGHYNYTLIVSQHTYSRHVFIVEHEEHFLEQAKSLVRDLQHYKRGSLEGDPPRYGDLKSPYRGDGQLAVRHNVNDYGDIYFFHASRLSPLIEEIGHFKKEEESERILYSDERFDESRDIRNQLVFRRHDECVVKEIVERYFHLL